MVSISRDNTFHFFRKRQLLYLVVVFFLLCYNLRRNLIEILNMGDAMIQDISSAFGLFLQFANIVIIGYGLYKFLNKPHDTLAEELKKIKEEQTQLLLEIKELKKAINNSFDKHREQDKTNKVFKRVFILLANFEVTYCQETGFVHTDDLVQAKKELNDYLAGD